MPNFTPDEYRAQVIVNREKAREITEPVASFLLGLSSGMLLAAAEQIEALEKELDDMTATLKAANDLLEREE